LSVISPSFGNIWDIMGYQSTIVNTLFFDHFSQKSLILWKIA